MIHISVITLKKRRNFKFLTQDLQELGIPYRWGFPFRLQITYNAKEYMVRTEQDVRSLHKRIQLDLKAGKVVRRRGDIPVQSHGTVDK